MKVIFLDIDGVLNGWNPVYSVVSTLAEKLKLDKWARRIITEDYDVYGVHESKVKLLSKICKKSGAVIVVSSTWRGGLFSNKIKNERLTKFWDLMHKYEISVVGRTGTVNTDDYYWQRTYEIQEWLSQHENIESYVILDDDNILGMEDKQVKTLSRNPISKYQDWEGLRRKHIKQALKILKEKVNDS